MYESAAYLCSYLTKTPGATLSNVNTVEAETGEREDKYLV